MWFPMILLSMALAGTSGARTVLAAEAPAPVDGKVEETMLRMRLLGVVLEDVRRQTGAYPLADVLIHAVGDAVRNPGIEVKDTVAALTPGIPRSIHLVSPLATTTALPPPCAEARETMAIAASQKPTCRASSCGSGNQESLKSATQRLLASVSVPGSAGKHHPAAPDSM